MFKLKKICVLGLGYIGLPTLTVLANKDYDVIGVDTNKKVTNQLNKGKIHITEPLLEEKFKIALERGKIVFSQNPIQADVFIICVPTPFKKDKNFSPDLTYVEDAVKNILDYISQNSLIIIESTIPVGTTQKIYKLIKNKVKFKFYLAHCPERVLPGKILKEIVENDRVVGGIYNKDTKIAAKFYKSFVTGNVIETDSKTAEMCKLTENSFRDVNIAFANELSILCDKMDIDVDILIKIANLHPRVNILKPGVGVGGHCIAVDPWFIISQNKLHSQLIKKARTTNERKKIFVIKQIIKISEKFYNMNGKQPKIACLGLTYKPDIDDLRNSPALEVVEKLISLNINVLSVEPNIKKYQGIKISSLHSAIIKSDIIVVLVAHKEFKGLEKKYNLNKTNFINFA